MQDKPIKDPQGPRKLSWRGPQVAGALCVIAGLAGTPLAHSAGITIEPADGPVSMAGLTADLDCDDLVVNGTLDASGATFQRVGNVIIGAGGSLTATNASIEVTQSWQNNGSFSGAGSTLTASNACANTGTAFSGNTTFYNFSATSPGLVLSFATGSEQKVGGLLTLHDVTLQAQGGWAYLTLSQGGTQNISTVGVNSVDASRGQRLAPTQTNQIGGRAPNWFSNRSSFDVSPVPTNGPLGLTLLGLLLSAAMFLRRQVTSRRS
ncbi:hypothetical protein [Ottowia sp. VDI28]|uniref:hypothetical protein n=1 Tax=Ottowia sp. VDI28 TaxID=3133968 RepID=UPI003C2B9988